MSIYEARFIPPIEERQLRHAYALLQEIIKTGNDLLKEKGVGYVTHLPNDDTYNLIPKPLEPHTKLRVFCEVTSEGNGLIYARTVEDETSPREPVEKLDNSQGEAYVLDSPDTAPFRLADHGKIHSLIFYSIDVLPLTDAVIR